MHAAAWLCGLLVFSAAMWTVAALQGDRGSTRDTAGLLVGVASAGLAVWGLWAALRALRGQRTALVIAAELARAVLKEEGKQYRQLLGGDLQSLNGPIDLRFNLIAASGVSHGGGGPGAEGSLRNIAAYYRSLAPGRLVITGASGNTAGTSDAGTGKTVLAVALILGLARDRAASEPVPIRLSASSWSGDSIRNWLVTHLIRVFHFPLREARALVEAHFVLPVIDGLDEMDAVEQPGYTSRAAQLLRAVEAYEREGAKAPVVVTCRRPHYEALVDADTHPQVSAEIGIARVDAGHIRGYLRERIGYSEQNLARWQELLDAVTAPSASPVLTEALNTPWRLTLAAVVYEERDPDTGVFLRDPKDLVRLADSGELYEHLLDRYIKAAVHARSGGEGQWPRRRLDHVAVWRHLAVLAAYLHSNTARPPRIVAGRELSGTDMVLDELWPLAGVRRPRVVSALLVVFLAFFTVGLYLMADGANTVVNAVFYGTLTVLGVAAAYGVAWPQPARISLRTTATLSGFGRVVSTMLAGGAVGGMLGGLYYSIDWFASGVPPYEFWELIHWPSVPGWVGFVGLLYLTLSVRDHPLSDPRGGLRGDLATWLASACLLGALEAVELLARPEADTAVRLEGPALGASALAFGLALVIGWGLVFSLKDSFPATQGIRGALGGPASLRYVSFLLCTRGHLPWRLGSLLHCCYEMGLLRVAGAAYQFRHRELQEHLATRPHSPGARSVTR